MKARRACLPFAVAIPILCLCAIGVYFLPPVHDRLSWRVDEFILRMLYTLNPPQEQVFIPTQLAAPTPQASVTLSEITSPRPSPSPSVAPDTPLPTQPPTPTFTPLPPSVSLTGVRYEDQHGRLNYCAPANLAMALSFWGWQGNRDVVGPILKPDVRDKNVMPYEMAAYVTDYTDLGIVTRVGGDVETIKRFIAAGYPVLVEKSVYFRDLTGVVSWMGHYQVLTGYDEAAGFFIAQDSFTRPDSQVSYTEMIKGWRSFNFIYQVIYAKEREAEVLGLLGPDADATANFQNAALKASNEILGLSGIDQYFAWFNRGTNLVELQDYGGAAQAYDQAFAVYPTIPENERPWRMLWYSTGPYWAYYYTQRYYDLLYLADGTLNAMQGDRNLEESYYWRGMAKAALGDTAGAIEDFRLALKYHPGFEPALYQLQALGAQNP